MSITALAVVEKEIRGSEVMANISNSLGKPASDPSVMKFINGAVMYMQSKVGQKGDVSHCSKQSIIDSLICAATNRLPVDSKHYACLIAYGTTCTFQPEWRGYIAKIKEADPSAEITPVLVFKGDKFTYSRKDGNVVFEHITANPFEDDQKNIIGAYCYIKTDKWSDIEVMSKKELDEVRASSKAGYAYIWNSWPLEQYRKTIIRRGCKRKFTAAVAELDALDNRLYVEKTGPDAPKITETSPLPPVQEAVVVDDVDTDPIVKEEPVEPSIEALKAKADEAKAKLHSEEPKAQPTASQTPKNDDNVATGLIAYAMPKNKGGYRSYAIEGKQREGGKDMMFSTNDATMIETLDDRLAKEQKVSFRFVPNENPNFAANIVELIAVE